MHFEDSISHMHRHASLQLVLHKVHELLQLLYIGNLGMDYCDIFTWHEPCSCSTNLNMESQAITLSFTKDFCSILKSKFTLATAATHVFCFMKPLLSNNHDISANHQLKFGIFLNLLVNMYKNLTKQTV